MKILFEPRKLIVLVLICLISTVTSAQSENNISNQKKENREALKIAFFTAKMNLNTEESSVFWPVLNEMKNELKDLKNERKIN